jgi:transcriptional regulator with XRE-family HTH domain
MNVGQRIREARETLGMQRTVLARRVGVAPNTIWRYEAGHNEPSVAMMEKLARELRTEPAEFLRESAPSGKASAPPETGPALLDKLIDAVLQDAEERGQKAINREVASQGVREGADAVVSAFAVDKVQAEFREHGIPDELFENYILPLAARAARVERLEHENARLVEEVARLQGGAGRPSSREAVADPVTD